MIREATCEGFGPQYEPTPEWVWDRVATAYRVMRETRFWALDPDYEPEESDAAHWAGIEEQENEQMLRDGM